MASELSLSMNGAKQVVSAAPETPLLFVLRNDHVKPELLR